MPYLNSHGSTFGGDKSKAFLLGLYIGLSLLLLLVAGLDPASARESNLHKATNIYGVLALAGAGLGFWRIWKRAEDPKALPALSSLTICAGLALWAIGQIVWTWRSIKLGKDEYPGPHDIFYMGSNLCWLIALMMIFRSLGRRSLEAINPFIKVLVPFGLSLFVTGLPTWIASRFDPASLTFSKIACDFGYIFLTLSSVLLAVGLLLGENQRIPFPIHQCIRYLAAATAIDAIAILAFTVTMKLPIGHTWRYYNGNWVDWSFLTAMYCWGVSALKCPIRPEALLYSFHTLRGKVMGVEDIYRANEIAKASSETAPLVDSASISWIQGSIPGCWRVIKLGELVVGSTFVFPVPRQVIDRLREARPKEYQTEEREVLEEVKKSEREIFDEVKKNPLTWDCLYLADASILTKHRRRGLVFKSFCDTIQSIKDEHKCDIEVYCSPFSPETRKLAEKLRAHFENKIKVNPLE